ncbi:acyltransferase [Eremococcus coleocola]|uniref:Acyltransferase 3 domain-containing protein n=1 Tax=Eremococcus coleocola ACS-139-V-Col8 TaxID=908337 RepID=E4KQM3_9LACT|nr:acyltransferase [Eremococcus coleocola]EFR30634.1 hypothetical protein HMPREF9257_0582 [Eremococcus coleocola ACS-139-V-Col8]
MVQQENRQSNFELLRLISMALIVIHHYAYHGAVDINAQVTQQSFALQILSLGGTVGVNVFVMIGSYFLIGKEFKWRRTLKIIIDVFLYSYLIFAVYAIFKPQYLHDKNIINFILPFPGSYWFAAFYVLLILFTPGLNYIIEHFSRKNLKNTLYLFAVLLVIGPSLTLYDFSIEWKRLLTFIFLYLLTAYIKLYLPDYIDSLAKGRKLTLWATGLLVLIVIIMLATDAELESSPATDILIGQNKIFIILISCGLFIWFKNWHLASIKWINALSGATFGVYLIHEQPLLRQAIWQRVANDQVHDFATSLFGGFISGFGVFLVCLLLAYLVEKILGRFTNKLAVGLGQRMDNWDALL